MSCSGFITLIDRSSLARKRTAFSAASILNITLLALMIWLVYIIVVRDVLTPLDMNDPLVAGFYLAQDFLVGWAGFSLLTNTTIPFFFGEYPLRLHRGFRPIEIIFLPLPTLDTSLPDDMHSEHYQRLASSQSRIGSGSCAIAYSAALEVYGLMDSGEIAVDELDSAVWRRENGIWGIVSRVSKVEEKAETKA